MTDFDYSIIDGDATTRKIRGEDLGLDGSNVQIIGHKVPAVGAIDDAAAADQSGSSTVVSILKGMLRELLSIETNTQTSGGGSASYTEGVGANPVSVTSTETVLVTIDCRGKSRVGLTVQNTSATAFNSFQTKIRTNSTFSFHFPEATSTADYTTGSGDQTGNATALVRKSNGDPTSLSNDYRWIRYNVESLDSLQITATVASGSTDVNVWWIAE